MRGWDTRWDTGHGTWIGEFATHSRCKDVCLRIPIPISLSSQLGSSRCVATLPEITLIGNLLLRMFVSWKKKNLLKDEDGFSVGNN